MFCSRQRTEGDRSKYEYFEWDVRVSRARCFSPVDSSMSFVEGIGDDVLHVVGLIAFICLVSLAWLSTHVNPVPFVERLFIVEHRRHRPTSKYPGGEGVVSCTTATMEILGDEHEGTNATMSSGLYEQSFSINEQESDVE